MTDGIGRIGGALALAFAVLLGFVVMVGTEPNAANLWTIALCGSAGALALGSRHMIALVLLILGVAPALAGGVGVLFVPSIFLLAVGLIPSHRQAASTSD